MQSLSFGQRLSNTLVKIGHKNVFRFCTNLALLRAVMNTAAKVNYPIPSRVARRDFELPSESGTLKMIAFGDEQADRVLIYHHGGGYVMGSEHTHGRLAALIAERTQSLVLFPLYRLAPDFAPPAQLDDALTCYRHALSLNKPVWLCGESAGGSLSMSLLAQIKAEGLTLPNGTSVFSPCTDWRDRDSAERYANSGEMMLTLNFLRTAHRSMASLADHYQVTPILGDYRGCTPVQLQVAKTEYLYPDSVEMHALLQRQEVDSELVEFGDVHHAWQLSVGRSHEADLSIEHLRVFMARTA